MLWESRLCLLAALFAFASTCEPTMAQEKQTVPESMLNLGPEVDVEFALVPYPFVGKLSFTKFGTSDGHHCTAAFVKSDVLLTAAHCIQDPTLGGPNHTFAFILHNGTSYPIRQNCVKMAPNFLSVTDKYFRIQHDFAFLRTTTSVPGMPKGMLIRNDTENTFNKDVKLYGYPGLSGSLFTLFGKTKQDVLHPTLTAFKTNNTAFTEGASGGPWVVDGSEKILSLNSSFSFGLYNPSYIRVYGPVFRQDAADLQDETAGCS